MTRFEAVKELLPFYLGLYVLCKFGFQIAVFKTVNYWMLRQSLPLAIFFFSLQSTTKKKFLNYVYILGISAIVGFMVVRNSLKHALLPLIGYFAGYWICIEYIIFAMTYLVLFSRKTRNEVRAFAYTLLVLPVVGLMYEVPSIPYTPHRQWISTGPPFFIRSSVVGFVLMAWKYGYASWKQKKVLLLCTLLTVFYLFRMLHPTMKLLGFPYTTRLSGFIFWVFMIYFWKGERQTRLNG